MILFYVARKICTFNFTLTLYGVDDLISRGDGRCFALNVFGKTEYLYSSQRYIHLDNLEYLVKEENIIVFSKMFLQVQVETLTW